MHKPKKNSNNNLQTEQLMLHGRKQIMDKWQKDMIEQHLESLVVLDWVFGILVDQVPQLHSELASTYIMAPWMFGDGSIRLFWNGVSCHFAKETLYRDGNESGWFVYSYGLLLKVWNLSTGHHTLESILGGWFHFCFYFHPYFWKIPIFDSYFSKGLKPPTSIDRCFFFIIGYVNQKIGIWLSRWFKPLPLKNKQVGGHVTL